jgi:3-oxoacyl-[acyl-carrier-protein] synthase-1
MAAGTVRFLETDVLDDSGEPVRASMLTLLEPGLTRMERMVSLAVTALDEALKAAASLEIEQLPLLLALPEPGSGAPFEREAVLKALEGAAAPVRLGVSERSLFPEGRAGLFRALSEAAQLLKARAVSGVLVGGVDSMCDRDSLEHLARAGRSLGPLTRDGIIPGEGAGFFLLTSPLSPEKRRVSPLGWLVGCALSHEPHSFLQQKPNLAEGLTDAFRQLRKQPVTGNRRVDLILSCQTGESFWAQEFNYAYLRNAPLMPEPLTVSLVAESLGDVGAAAGAVQLGSALHQLKKLEPTHGAAARVLLYGCADAGQVGACIIEGGT